MLNRNASNRFHVSEAYQPLMRMLALDGQTVFDHPDIRCWRKLPDRENCTLDADLPDGRHARLHIKRYQSVQFSDEVEGHRLLRDAGIPTAPLVAYGTFEGKSFVIFDDLSGYTPADKLVERGMPFSLLLNETADLAAKLHGAGLHHRDLYLCHFMAKEAEGKVDRKLIDTARVKRLPRGLTRRRWIVKDLAQFWYSTLKLPVTDEQREQWLQEYARRQNLHCIDRLRRSVERKVRAIARHDARLHRSRPERDVSIPQG